MPKKGYKPTLETIEKIRTMKIPENELFVILIVILTIAIFVGLIIQLYYKPSPYGQIERQNCELTYIQKNSIISNLPPATYENITYGTLIDDSVLYEIVKCESNFNPSVCNYQYGCGSGIGLAQLIPSTIKYCEEKLGRKIDPFNAEDNLMCAQWLLENEGTKHWDQSKKCWGSEITGTLEAKVAE